MAGIRKAARWVAEGKIVARHKYPMYRYKARGIPTDFAYWVRSYNGHRWHPQINLYRADFTATDWEIVP